MPTSAQNVRYERLQVRLLGDLQVCRDGKFSELPASKKTRALLAYLAVTGKRHLRSDLCDLLWEGVEDPRAALRWSLTKLRPVLSQQDKPALRADREGVVLPAGSVMTDLEDLRALIGNDIASAPLELLTEAVLLFRGEFINGLELPNCYRYHEWCLAEREAAGQTYEQVLTALVGKLNGRPAEALVYARALVARDPLNEGSHIAVMRILTALGRKSDALAQYDQCRRILERELGIAPSARLDAARHQLNNRIAVRSNEAGQDFKTEQILPAIPNHRPGDLVGRVVEVAHFAQVLKRMRAGRGSDVILFSGSPGIGKSRLLDELARQVMAAGGTVLHCRAFEAEMVRPFGCWIDALRNLREATLPAHLYQALSPLLDGLIDGPVAKDRERLFDAVLASLSYLAEQGPVAILVDDLQWVEESSTALLHYAIRNLVEKGILFALAARAGELEDNAAAQTLIAAQAQARRLKRVALAPLSSKAAADLVRSIAPGIEPADIVASAEGNPLFLIELARMQSEQLGSDRILGDIFDARLARLTEDAGELLQLASAFGRRFPLDTLIDAYGIEYGPAVKLLSELERHDLIRGTSDGSYVFSHDLIQQTAYGRVSQPRRRLIHANIAKLLNRQMGAAPRIAGDVAHHAGLGEQYELAARAALAAAEHDLRVFANGEAIEMARRGLHHAERIADRIVRVGLSIPLLRIQVLAASGSRITSLPRLAELLKKAIGKAQELRLYGGVAQGYYLLSILSQETGDFAAAQEATLQAADASKMSDSLSRARQLANTARCLTELGRDIGRARDLIGQAVALTQATGVDEVEVSWCSGLLHNWDGDLDGAARDIERAFVLAGEAEDRWRECKCLGWLAMIELERRRPKQALARAKQLSDVARKLGEGADAPLAQAIEVLARQMSGDRAANLDGAIAGLRAADDKSHLAYVLNLAASIQIEANKPEMAESLAAEALTMAEAIGEANETAFARATLVEAALARGDDKRAALEFEELQAIIGKPGIFSARVNRAASRATKRFDLSATIT